MNEKLVVVDSPSCEKRTESAFEFVFASIHKYIVDTVEYVPETEKRRFIIKTHTIFAVFVRSSNYES